MKKRVLLNWDTSRRDLLEPFIALKDDIDFFIIWGTYSIDEEKNHPFRQVYFTDYNSPYQLLKEIRPDKVLFFNINSFTHVALNLAAKNLGIHTYVMHHGIHHADLLEMNKTRERVGLHKKRKLISNVRTFRFYFSALRLTNINQLISYCRFAWIRQKRDKLLAAEKCVFDARLPDHYINLSPHNAILAKRVDHIDSDDKFFYIGHPFFDQILSRLNALKDEHVDGTENYFLLIDFPNIENHLSFKLMTGEKKFIFYKQLSNLAKSQGCRLKIKLHPFGFDSPYNYSDENIDLIRDENDMASLIHYAKKCFSFFSTLLIPIIYHKGSCYVFHIGQDRHLQKELVDLGVAIKLDTAGFTAKDLQTSNHEVSPASYQTFIERYLYYTDGKSTERLKHILAAG